MAVTGITSDGHFVIDDRIDDSGRMVVDAVNRLLDDGTTWTHIPQTFTQATDDTVSLVESLTNDQTVAPVVTGITADGRFVFSDLVDDTGRRVVAAASSGAVGMMIDGTTYVLIPPPFGGFTKALADTVALAESFTRAVATTKEENLALVEALAKSVSRAAADSLGLSEADSAQVQKRLEEDLGISEALTARQVRLLHFEDSLSLEENLSGGVVLPEFDETFTLSESMRAELIKNFTEALALNEVFLRVTGKRLSDSLGFSETFTALSVKLKALAETLTLTETLAKRVIRAVAEQVTLSESFAAVPSTGGGSTFSQTGADNLGLSEQVTRVGGRPVGDTAELTEAWQLSTTKVIGELAGLTEGVQFAVARVLGIAEQIALTELLQPLVVRLLGLGDDLTLGESLSASVTSAGVRHVGLTVTESSYLATSVEVRP